MATKYKQFKLEDICRAISSRNDLIKGKQIQEFKEGLYPAYSATGQDIWREEYEHEGSAIIVSAVGARCGKCFRADVKWTAIANTHIIYPNENIDRNYLFYHLNDESFWERGGLAQPFVKIKDTLRRKSIPIPVDIHGDPDLKEQKRIVSVLEEAEDLKKKRAKADQKMSEIIPALFSKMFGDPNKNPMNWPMVPLSELGALDRGKSQHRPRTAPELFGGSYPFVQTGDITNAGWRITEHHQTYSDKGLQQSKLWPKGTLCITIAANIARTAILDFEACFPDSVVGFVPNKENNADYVQGLFIFLQRRLEEMAPRAAQLNINLAILRTLKVPKPPKGLQDEFAEKVKEIIAFEIKQKKSGDHINILFRSLLSAIK